MDSTCYGTREVPDLGLGPTKQHPALFPDKRRQDSQPRLTLNPDGYKETINLESNDDPKCGDFPSKQNVSLVYKWGVGVGGFA